jgi:hypothetical protein
MVDAYRMEKEIFCLGGSLAPPDQQFLAAGIDDISVLSHVPAIEGADVHGNRNLFGIDALALGGGNPLKLFRQNGSPIDKA